MPGLSGQPRLRRRTDDVKAKLKLAHASCHANLHRFLFFLIKIWSPKLVPNITALSCACGETLRVSENLPFPTYPRLRAQTRLLSPVQLLKSGVPPLQTPCQAFLHLRRRLLRCPGLAAHLRHHHHLLEAVCRHDLAGEMYLMSYVP